jgi:predicted nucleic acid-binding protein
LLADEAMPLVIPNLALVEVAGSISRTRRRPAKALAFAHTIQQLAHITVVPLSSELAATASRLAAEHALRGADAVYAAVALSAGTTLITLDGEHLGRLSSVLRVLTPGALWNLLQGVG